jgi:hypothetical protein
MHYRRGFGGDMGISQKKKKRDMGQLDWNHWIHAIIYFKQKPLQ